MHHQAKSIKLSSRETKFQSTSNHEFAISQILLNNQPAVGKFNLRGLYNLNLVSKAVKNSNHQLQEVNKKYQQQPFISFKDLTEAHQQKNELELQFLLKKCNYGALLDISSIIGESFFKENSWQENEIDSLKKKAEDELKKRDLVAENFLQNYQDLAFGEKLVKAISSNQQKIADSLMMKKVKEIDRRSRQQSNQEDKKLLHDPNLFQGHANFLHFVIAHNGDDNSEIIRSSIRLVQKLLPIDRNFAKFLQELDENGNNCFHRCFTEYKFKSLAVFEYALHNQIALSRDRQPILLQKSGNKQDGKTTAQILEEFNQIRKPADQVQNPSWGLLNSNICNQKS